MLNYIVRELLVCGKSNLVRKTSASQKTAKLTPAIEGSDKSMYMYIMSPI